MTAKFNADILARLGEASPEELAAALAAISEDSAAFRGVPATQDNVTAMQALADAANAINAQTASRKALADKATAALAEIDAATAEPERAAPDQSGMATAQAAAQGAGTEGGAETGDTEETGTEGETDDNTEDDPEDGTDDGTAPDENEGGTVTASGRRKLGGVKTTSGATSASLPVARVTTTALAATGTTQFGEALDRKALAEAFSTVANNVRSLNGRSARPERYPVAKITTEYPEARRLGRESFANMERVEAVVEAARTTHALDNGQALVAAGLCAPLETLYDVRVIGDTDRPVRDALVRFGADRGGIQYRPAINGVSQTGGIGIWTEADDEADPLVPKTCVEIDCPGIVSAQVEAIYQCLTMSNMSTRFDPESMDAAIKAQAIAHARVAENRLLTTLTTASTRVYSTQVLGATRDILVTLDKMVAYFRSVYRLNSNAALRLILPSWARELMRADITRQMVGDGLDALAITDEMIADWFRRRNVNVTWHLDGIDPANMGAPVIDIVNQQYAALVADASVPPFPDVISAQLFVEGDWLFLDGGTLDLGVVRDSDLNGQNRFQTFSESWEFPAFRGLASFHLVMRVQPTGQSAATASTAGVTD
jgi:hypothetical protein